MSVDADELRARYLAALRRAVAGSADRYPYRLVERPRRLLEAAVFDAASESQMKLVTREPPARKRSRGHDQWSITAQTTMGPTRLEHLQEAVQTVLHENVPGNLIELGTWRGGGAILMSAVLHAHGVTNREVWVADSFGNSEVSDDVSVTLDDGPASAVSVEEVEANFAAYDLLDDQVRIIPDSFHSTLPGLADQRWAIIRVDGNLDEPTLRALEHLYQSLETGGFLIIDDYGAAKSSKLAVRAFRRAHSISESLETIDWSGVFWRKTARPQARGSARASGPGARLETGLHSIARVSGTPPPPF